MPDREGLIVELECPAACHFGTGKAADEDGLFHECCEGASVEQVIEDIIVGFASEHSQFNDSVVVHNH